MVTGGARLMLALLEPRRRPRWRLGLLRHRQRSDRRSAPGGLIPCPGGPHPRQTDANPFAPSWTRSPRLPARFDSCQSVRSRPRPLDRSSSSGRTATLGTGEQRQLYCYAISAKRYALYTLDAAGEPQLAKLSEHALGGFDLNPLDPDHDDRDWVDEAPGCTSSARTRLLFLPASPAGSADRH